MGFSDLKIQNNGKFLKIDQGVPHDVRILEPEPFVWMEHGFGKEGKECAGEHCQQCAGGHVPSQRFSVNVYDYGAKRVMLWQFGSGIAKKLKSISVTLEDDQKTLADVDIKVECEGSGLAKKYAITPRMSAKTVPMGLVLLRHQELPF